MSNKVLEDAPVPTKVKLSLLWASLMALYIYNDYFILFVPGTIEGMSEGSLGPLGMYTDAKMSGIALILAIPASMIFLSSILSNLASRRLNLVLGAIYLLIVSATLIGSPYFYKLIVGFEIVATLLVLRIAYRWPTAD